MANKAAFNKIHCELQFKPQEMQNSRLSRKTEEIQDLAHHEKAKKYFTTVETIYGLTYGQGASPQLDGSVLMREMSPIGMGIFNSHNENLLRTPIR